MKRDEKGNSWGQSKRYVEEESYIVDIHTYIDTHTFMVIFIYFIFISPLFNQVG